MADVDALEVLQMALNTLSVWTIVSCPIQFLLLPKTRRLESVEKQSYFCTIAEDIFVERNKSCFFKRHYTLPLYPYIMLWQAERMSLRFQSHQTQEFSPVVSEQGGGRRGDEDGPREYLAFPKLQLVAAKRARKRLYLTRQRKSLEIWVWGFYLKLGL